MVLRALELCAGYGGFSLALRVSGIPSRTVCYVEREAFAAAVLVRAMQAGALDEAPVWSDLATFDGGRWHGAVDLVTAGFPCQPWSVAGKRGGEADERYHGVWPHIARIVGECRPGLVFLENVSLDAFRGPRGDLEDLGYRVPPAVRVSASDVGAPHERERWWVLAHAADAGRAAVHVEPRRIGRELADWVEPGRAGATDADGHGEAGHVAHAIGSRLEVGQGEPGDDGAELAASQRGLPGGAWDEPPADLCRVADGVASRTDRLRAIGNGIVPLAGAAAFRLLLADALGQPGGY